MQDFAVLGLFAVACLALAVTPGPDMLLIASRSISQGRRAGVATLAGIETGIYCHATAAALGLSQLFLAVPAAYDAVRWAGAGYLLWLAWRTLRSGGGAWSPSRTPRPLSLRHVFRQGLVTNLLNPKVALFVLALFPQFLQPAAGPIVAQTLILATIMNIIGLLINGLVILTASRIGRTLFARPRLARLQRYVLGTVFTGLACRLALASRP